MDFTILPSDNIPKESLIISLPQEVRLELGLLLGQMIQFNNGSQETFLKVVMPLGEGQKEALVSRPIFELIGAQETSYSVPVITLGCDPEFFITYRGRKVSAATYLPFEGQIGCDGDLGELRPMYGRHESQVVNNLAALIREVPSRMKRADWADNAPDDMRHMDFLGYSYFRHIAAGFHVHLGVPPEILNTRQDVSRPVLNYLIKVLDWYVSAPLVLLETENERRRGQSKYGKPGDYRTTNVTLEYRTPGGFYLRSPTLAGGLLGLSLLLTEHLVGEIKNITKDFVDLRKLTTEDLLSIIPLPKPSLVQLALSQEDKSLARRAYPVIRDRLRKLPNYQSHSAAIEDFFSIVDSGKVPMPNLLPNWENHK